MSLSLVVDLRPGLLIPRSMQYTKKSSYFRTSSSLNMAVRGIRTPIRCRIHTFGRAPSATRTPHQIVVPVLLERALI